MHASTRQIVFLRRALDFSDLFEIVKSYPRVTFVDDRNKEKVDVMNKYFLMFGDEDSHRSKEDLIEERKWRKWADDSLVHMLRL